MANEPTALEQKIEALYASGDLDAEAHAELLAAAGDTQATGGASPTPPAVTGAADPPPTQIVNPSNTQAGGVHPATVAPGDEPGKPVGDDAPALSDLQNKLCPNCKTGVLYVTRYDPHAAFEQGQDIAPMNSPQALPSGHGSGGGYEAHCFACEYNASFPFNPGARHGTVRP